MPESNLERLTRGYEAFGRGDLGPARDILAEDVDWGTTAVWPGTEPSYRGADELESWMLSVLSAWKEFSVEVDEVLRDDGSVLVVSEHLSASGLESGVEVEMHTYSAYWFERGRITRRRAFTAAEEALAAAEER